MNRTLKFLASIQFGELEISNTTVIILVFITIFIFIAVGLSSFKLVQSAFVSEEED